MRDLIVIHKVQNYYNNFVLYFFFSCVCVCARVKVKTKEESTEKRNNSKTNGKARTQDH